MLLKAEACSLPRWSSLHLFFVEQHNQVHTLQGWRVGLCLLQLFFSLAMDKSPWLPHSGTHAAQLLDVTADRYLQDAELLAQGAILCAEHYHRDGIPLLDDPQMEAISLGCTPRWSAQGPPTVISSPLYHVAPERLLEHLPPLPDETTGRWPTVIAGRVSMIPRSKGHYEHIFIST
jgi:hypothetical protein